MNPIVTAESNSVITAGTYHFVLGKNKMKQVASTRKLRFPVIFPYCLRRNDLKQALWSNGRYLSSVRYRNAMRDYPALVDQTNSGLSIGCMVFGKDDAQKIIEWAKSGK